MGINKLNLGQTLFIWKLFLGQKLFFGQNLFLGLNFFRVKNFLWLNNSFWGQKNLGSKTISGSKSFWGSTKFLCQNFFRVKPLFGSKFFWVKNFLNFRLKFLKTKLSVLLQSNCLSLVELSSFQLVNNLFPTQIEYNLDTVRRVPK